MLSHQRRLLQMPNIPPVTSGVQRRGSGPAGSATNSGILHHLQVGIFPAFTQLQELVSLASFTPFHIRPPYTSTWHYQMDHFTISLLSRPPSVHLSCSCFGNLSVMHVNMTFPLISLRKLSFLQNSLKYCLTPYRPEVKAMP